MKLPNGFGTCYKLGGNRRRPWVVKKTINGKQKTLGYFATYVDGLSHLFAVNDTDVMQSEIPFSAIYERWRKEHFPSISVSSQKAYEICPALFCVLVRKNAGCRPLENPTIFSVPASDCARDRW